jgi:hypothetical protein
MNKKITFNLLTNSLNFQVCLRVLFPLNNIMKKALISTFLLTSLVSQMNAALIFGGDFQAYKPGSGNSVTATFATTNSYAQGLGPNLQLLQGGGVDIASVTYSDLSTPGAVGGAPDVDMPGWKKIHGSFGDIQANGVGGSTGMGLYAAWGGQGRIETENSVGTIIAGQDYKITAMLNGDAGSPITGSIAFHLLANGVQLIPSAFSIVDPMAPYTTFQQISRSYNASDLAGLVGQSLTIVVGVEDDNNIGGRLVFDDISLETVPEPTSVLLGSLSLLALLRRRRKA